MKKKLIQLLALLFIIGSLAMVLFSGLQGENLQDLTTAVASMGTGALLLCLMSYFGFVLFDALGIWYFLRRQGANLPLSYLLFVSLAGTFFSGVTPGASGGQPMQVYYLHRRSVPIGLASSALIVRFFSFQFMLFAVGTALWISHGPYIYQQVGSNMWLLIVGYVYNALMVSGLVLITLRRGIVAWLINLGLKLGVRLHLIRRPDVARSKCVNAVNTFHDSIGMLTRNPRDLIVQLLIGGSQLLCLMSVLYFIYHGLHLHGASFWQIISMHLMEFTSAAYLPTPGGSGAQEVTFSLYFGGIFPEGTRMAALLVWRFFTYYIALLLGGLVAAIYSLRNGRFGARQAQQSETKGSN